MTTLRVLSMSPRFPCSTTGKSGPVSFAGDCRSTVWPGCAACGRLAELSARSDSARSWLAARSSLARRGRRTKKAVNSSNREKVASWVRGIIWISSSHSVLIFMCFRVVAHIRVQREALPRRELRGNKGVGCARRRKWDERQYWHAPRSLRTGHESLPRLIPTQGEQDFLTLSDNSERTLPNELPVRLKKSRYNELLRAGDSLENQEGLHFQMMTCDSVFQRELLHH